MNRPAAWLATLQQRWSVGFALVLLGGLAVLGYGALAAIILLGVQLITGISEEAFATWLALSALIWLPLAIGTIVPTFLRGRDLVLREPENSRSSPAA